MNPKKVEYMEGMARIRNRVEKQGYNYEEKPFEPLSAAASEPPRFVPKEKVQKICPVTGQPCNSKCKWFRFNKAGHNCPVQEIYANSWHLNEIKELLLEIVIIGREWREQQKEK